MNREQRRQLRHDPWARQLALEGVQLDALGLLDEYGDVRCRDCRRFVERLGRPGQPAIFSCECGWRLEFLSTDWERP